MKPWEPGDLLCWDTGGRSSVSHVVIQAGRRDRLSLVHLFDLNGEPHVLVRVEHAEGGDDRAVVFSRHTLLSKQELRRDGLLTEWHDAATTP